MEYGDKLAAYINFITFAGVDTNYSFQNYHNDSVRVYNSRNYLHAGFGYTGATLDIGAANLEAELVFVASEVMYNIAQLAYDNEWLVQIATVWLDPITEAETNNVLNEVYAVTSWATNNIELSLSLSSPLDAQRAELPARVLSREIAGDLPPTGTIEFI